MWIKIRIVVRVEKRSSMLHLFFPNRRDHSALEISGTLAVTKKSNVLPIFALCTSLQHL